MEKVWISPTDTAKMLRAALKEAYPLTKFSVRVHTYSGGHSTDVRWEDGPTEAQTKPLLDGFVSRGFDSMQDLAYSCGTRILNGVAVYVQGGYVTSERSISVALRAKIIDRLAYECGLGPVALTEYGDVRDTSLRVPFQWHSAWHEGPLTVDEVEGPEPLLAHSEDEEYFAMLAHRVAHAVSLEAAKEIKGVALPEYVEEVAAS